MTKEIGNLRTRLSFDKTGDSNITDLRRDLKGVRSEMNNFRASGREYRTSLKGMSQESDILTRRLKVQREQVAELKRRYDESKHATGENSAKTKDLAAQYNNAQAQMKRTEGQLERLNREIKIQQSGWTELGKRMETYGKKMQEVGRATSRFGRSYSMRVTAPIVAAGVAAIKVGMDFEEGMSKVQAISGATGSELENLREQAKDLGQSTRFSATQAADGMEFLARAGWKTKDIMSGMPGILDLAASSNMELGRAADIASNIMSAFNIEAEKAGYVADVLAHAAANANTDVEQMGEAMKYVAPTANTLGLSIEDTASAIMAVSDAGIQGSQAGRAFGTSLLRLSKPTTQMKDELSKLKVELFDAEGSLKSLPEIVGDLNNSMTGYTKEQKAASLATIFGTEATRHWSILLEEGADSLSKNTKELQDSEGAAERMAKVMQDNAKGAMIEFRSALEGAGIAASEHLIPAITDITKKATELVRKFGELDDDQQKQILKWLAITAAVGPAAVVLGSATTAVGGLLRVGGRLSTMIGAASGAGLAGRIGIMGAAAGPVGLATVAVGALGTGLYLLHKESKKAKEINTELAESYASQASELQTLVDEYNELNNKSKLTTDEFGRLMDIQSELNKTQNPALIAELNKEYDKLAEKSGLSKDEIIKLIEANDGIIEQSPQVERSFTEQGNAILESTDAVQEYINTLNEMSMIELQIERAKALEREAELMQEQIDLREEINLIESEIGFLLDAQLMSDEKRIERLGEIDEELQNQKLTHDEISTLHEEQAAILQAQTGSIGNALEKLQEQRDELIGKQELNDAELAKLEEINVKMADLLLSEVGINFEKGEGLKKLDDEITELENARSEMEKNTTEEKKKTREYQNQLSELDLAIDKHKDIRDTIKEETGYESESNKKKEEGRRKLQLQSNVASGIIKRLEGQGSEQDKNNKKFQLGIFRAEDMTEELRKGVDKDVNVSDNGTLAKIKQEATKSERKTVTLSAAWSGVQSGLSRALRGLRIPGFASGTNYAPGGPAWVGEEGFELARLGNKWSMLDFGIANVPRGTEIFTHDESKGILRALNNMPGYATGVSPSGESNRIISGLNNNQNASGQPVVLEIHLTSEIDGRTVAQSTEKFITEIQNRSKKVVGKFA